MPFQLRETRLTAAAGASAEATWVVPADTSFILRKIVAYEENGQGLGKVTISLIVDNKAYFREGVCAIVFNDSMGLAPQLDIPLSPGSSVRFIIRNDESGARTMRIIMHMEEVARG